MELLKLLLLVSGRIKGRKLLLFHFDMLANILKVLIIGFYLFR